MLKESLKVELSINGQKVNVGHKFLEDIVRNIPDVKENKKVFNLLSKSDNYTVREHTSRKEFLSSETIEVFLEDECDEVVDNILSSYDVNKKITDAQINKIIEKNNVRFLETIASNLDYYNSCNRCELLEKLLKHKSPIVKSALLIHTVSDLLSNDMLKILSDDEDFDVASKAKEELKDRLK